MNILLANLHAVLGLDSEPKHLTFNQISLRGVIVFITTLGGGFLIVGLHRLLAFLTRRNHWFGKLIKASLNAWWKTAASTARR